MNSFLYWFAIAHLVFYALCGFSFAFLLGADWLLRRFKLKRDFLAAAHRMFKERAALKETSA